MQTFAAEIFKVPRREKSRFFLFYYLPKMLRVRLQLHRLLLMLLLVLLLLMMMMLLLLLYALCSWWSKFVLIMIALHWGFYKCVIVNIFGLRCCYCCFCRYCYCCSFCYCWCCGTFKVLFTAANVVAFVVIVAVVVVNVIIVCLFIVIIIVVADFVIVVDIVFMAEQQQLAYLIHSQLMLLLSVNVDEVVIVAVVMG